MDVPLELSFKNIERSDAIEALIVKRVARLNRLCDRLTSCRVSIEAPHGQQREGDHYHVRIFMGVPKGELVVSRDPGDPNAHEDLRGAIQDAFAAAERQLEDYSRKMRGEAETSAPPIQGHIVSLTPEEDHGFIETTNGRELYFHRDAVIDAEFDDLEAGQTVEIVVYAGDGVLGPHASSVKPIATMQSDDPAP